MAKKPTKKPIEKKEFNLEDFKKTQGLNFTVKEKELTWIPLSEAFHDAVKVTGFQLVISLALEDIQTLVNQLRFMKVLLDVKN